MSCREEEKERPHTSKGTFVDWGMSLNAMVRRKGLKEGIKRTKLIEKWGLGKDVKDAVAEP